MDEDNKANYYAIIPADVRYDEELTDKAKLLYGEITCLSNKKGYCFATNNYFAKLYKCTNRAIQNSISKLQERGYIDVVVENNYQRKIFISSIMGYEKNFIGRNEKKFIGGYEKKFTNNNININMIDRFFYYIINNNNEKIPEEFSKTNEMEILDLLNKYEMLYTKESISYISEDNLRKIKDITYTIALIVKDNLQHLSHKVSRDKLIQRYNECKKREIENRDTENKIENFINYYYKSIVNDLTRENGPSFFMTKNEKTENLSSEEDEEGEEFEE